VKVNATYTVQIAVFRHLPRAQGREYWTGELRRELIDLLSAFEAHCSTLRREILNMHDARATSRAKS
jgi:hypothetical protein